jgi:hypothetical protein
VAISESPAQKRIEPGDIARPPNPTAFPGRPPKGTKQEKRGIEPKSPYRKKHQAQSNSIEVGGKSCHGEQRVPLMEQKGHRLALMVISTFKLPQSLCPSCGGSGRFVGMERHESLKNTSVLTFECDLCGDYAIDKPTLRAASSRIFRNTKADH